MPTDFFIKTKDSLKRVVENIANPMNLSLKEEDVKISWTIEKEEHGIKLLSGNTHFASVYRRGSVVVISEVINVLALCVAESLLEKYGFENVKWLCAPDGDLMFTVPR